MNSFLQRVSEYPLKWCTYCVAWLVPQETAAISAQVLWTPYNHAPCHFMQSHIRKVYVCLVVTCHLRFWQNDWGLLCATAVTWGWNGYRNKSQHRKLTLEKKIIPRSRRDSNPRPCNHESGALTTELSPPNGKTVQSKGAVWKLRWPSWAPVPNRPTVSVDVKQHPTKDG